MDGHKQVRGGTDYLTLWQPLAPAGYVAMGLLASVGGREPPSLHLVSPYRCVASILSKQPALSWSANSVGLLATHLGCRGRSSAAAGGGCMCFDVSLVKAMHGMEAHTTVCAQGRRVAIA